MTTHSSFSDLSKINLLAGDASALSFEIVDLAGFLDLVETQAQAQRTSLVELTKSSERVRNANTDVQTTSAQLGQSVDDTYQNVVTSVGQIRDMGNKSREVAEWVHSLKARTDEIGTTLQAVKKTNTKIASIALQVNTLAINAKIEAARAGDMGRGFAVVAEAINELSMQTKQAAGHITDNVQELNKWIASLSSETDAISNKATHVLTTSDETDKSLAEMETSVAKTQADMKRITEQSAQVDDALGTFFPSLEVLSSSVTNTSEGIVEAHARIESLVDTSERIVQSGAALGGTTEDGPFITFVQDAAKRFGMALDSAVKQGRITEAHLFTRRYNPIPGTDPEQVMAPFTELFDELLPPIQEPALDFDSKVVFCAAVDQNGYLPTHNRKFSQPQGDDPVWNTANCRNRRIFNDRVGLKAGRGTEPFLLQVYRRDMGGGEFVMMKDLSAPIHVNGKHWGGLRFAYKF